ncbi:MAG: hypothetical protein Q9200_006687 [Gallowayella weberi]
MVTLFSRGVGRSECTVGESGDEDPDQNALTSRQRISFNFKIPTSTMSTIIPTRSRVFLDVQGGSDFFGRIIIELFSDKTPKTAENFRAICAPPSSAAETLTYKGSHFHRIIDEFMIQGGDITAGNGTGGMSIYGPTFEDENIGWRKMDAAGLVCMANRGKDTNNSQFDSHRRFFITLAPCEHLNEKHTIFGHVIKGMDACERMAKVPVDKKDSPLFEVIVTHCGELERKSKPNTAPHALAKEINGEHQRTQEKGERQAKRSRSQDRSTKPLDPSPSPSRSRRHHEPSTPHRRRSDTGLDENRRGRTATRSVSPHVDSSRSPPRKRIYRRRSSPPSRSRSPKRSRSPHLRRRSTDRDRPPRHNGTSARYGQYFDEVDTRSRRHERRLDGPRDRYGPGYYGSHADQSQRRDHNDRNRDDSNRLGGRNGDADGSKEGNVVKFKGRGSMKYQEPRAW